MRETLRERDLECVGVGEVNAAASDEGAVEVEKLGGDVGERQVRHHAVHLESNAHVALHAVRTPYQLHSHIHTSMHTYIHITSILHYGHLFFMHFYSSQKICGFPARMESACVSSLSLVRYRIVIQYIDKSSF